MASLSRQLAQWVVGLRYDDLPPARTGPRSGAALRCSRWGWTRPTSRERRGPPGVTWGERLEKSWRAHAALL